MIGQREYAPIPVVVGEMLFEFSSFDCWVANASRWFTKSGFRGDDCICIDSINRICRTGKQFMRARDEGTFPIRVYVAVVR